MINSACISCQQPMNGGVYRKPNQCPHCLTLQDENRTAANKLMQPVLEQVASVEAAAPDLPLEEIEVSQEQYVELEEQNEAVEAIATADTIATAEAIEAAEKSIKYESSNSSSVSSEPEEEDFDLYIEEEVETEEATVVPEYFDNVEAKPDECESLDIALNLESSSRAAALSSAVASKSAVPIAASSESNVVVLKEKIVEARVGVASKEVQVAQISESEPLTAVGAEVNGPARVKKSQYAVTARQYETIVLTTEAAQNLDIEKRLDLVSAECVFATDMVKSSLSSGNGFSRAEYSSSPSVLKDARKAVLDEIKHEAFLLGANTVVEVKLEYSEIFRGKSAMMMVIATGTAVKTKAA